MRSTTRINRRDKPIDDPAYKKGAPWRELAAAYLGRLPLLRVQQVELLVQPVLDRAPSLRVATQ